MLSQKSCQRLASAYRPGTAHAVVAAAAANLPPTQSLRRSVAVAAAASDPISQLPQPIAEPLAYAKAFAAVALRHLTESAMDAAAEVSIQLAEQPKRMREFSEEVQAAAERELQSSGQQPQRLLTATSSASSGQGSSSSTSSLTSSAGSTDLEALVDDLRADIAASRALLQQIRAGNTGSQSGTQSTRR